MGFFDTIGDAFESVMGGARTAITGIGGGALAAIGERAQGGRLTSGPAASFSRRAGVGIGNVVGDVLGGVVAGYAPQQVVASAPQVFGVGRATARTSPIGRTPRATDTGQFQGPMIDPGTGEASADIVRSGGRVVLERRGLADPEDIFGGAAGGAVTTAGLGGAVPNIGTILRSPMVQGAIGGLATEALGLLGSGEANVAAPGGAVITSPTGAQSGLFRTSGQLARVYPVNRFDVRNPVTGQCVFYRRVIPTGWRIAGQRRRRYSRR